MIYPNTQPSGVVGGTGDNRQKLAKMLSQLGAAPLFGSSGRSASVASLPSIGAPSLSFNPFLKMLAGRPGETFAQLPQGISGALAAGIQNGPMNGYLGSSIPTSGGGASAPTPAGLGAPSAQQNLSTGYGHFNDTSGAALNVSTSAPSVPAAGQWALADNLAQQSLNANPTSGPASAGIGLGNPLYHTLLQLAMYGQDR